MLLTTMVAEAERMVDLENGPEQFELCMGALTIGNVALAGIPGKPFTAIGRAIKGAPGWDLVMPLYMWNEAQLDEALSTPSQALIEDMARLDGAIMILGAGGKVGPPLSVMAKRTMEASGVDRKIIAVSRFTDPFVVALMEKEHVECISCDLTKSEQIATLPKLKNIIYMAGRKFGTNGAECETWEMNVAVPAFNCVWQRYVNEVALRSLFMASEKVENLNVTAPELVSVRYAATRLGQLLGKPTHFEESKGKF